MYKSKEDRREAILKYVKKENYCSKEEVIRHLTKEGIGTKVPVSNDLRELIEEGILDPGKSPDSNSKNYKLTIIDDNPLVIVPRDLGTLYKKFENFVKIVSQLHDKNFNNAKKTEHNNYSAYNIHNANKSIPILPYDLIEIIDKIYNFYFMFVLPIEIKNNDLIARIYSSYFEMKLKMHILVTTEMNVNSLNDLTNIDKSPMYKSYIHSDIFTGMRKVSQIVLNCKILGIDSSLFEVLDFLWITNKKFLTLVYDSLLFPSDDLIKRWLRTLGKTLGDYYDYDDKNLKYLHIYVDYYSCGKTFLDDYLEK